MKICPHCETVLTSVNIQDLTGNASGRTQWKCIAYTCPHCSKVLSVQIDPVALKTDTLNAVQKLLQGWRR